MFANEYAVVCLFLNNNTNCAVILYFNDMLVKNKHNIFY